MRYKYFIKKFSINFQHDFNMFLLYFQHDFDMFSTCFQHVFIFNMFSTWFQHCFNNCDINVYGDTRRYSKMFQNSSSSAFTFSLFSRSFSYALKVYDRDVYIIIMWLQWLVVTWLRCPCHDYVIAMIISWLCDCNNHTLREIPYL